MKLVLILIFSLYLCNSNAANNSVACMSRSFVTYQPYHLAQLFKAEYYSFYKTLNMVFGKTETFTKKEILNIRQLCTCVILKFKESIDPDIKEDHNRILNTVKIERGSIDSPIDYYLYKGVHKFPVFICDLFEDKKYVILKGQSERKQVYNIYVLTATVDRNYERKYNFEGIIRNVDMEMPTFENVTSQQEQLANNGTPES